MKQQKKLMDNIIDYYSVKMNQGNKKTKYKNHKKKQRVYQNRDERSRDWENQKFQLVGSTQYISLSNSDLMYFGNLHNLSYSNFRVTIEKILLDLNILLSYEYKDFWKQLKQSSSLKHCLQSCLSNFPKKMYGRVKSKRDKQQVKLQENELFASWTGLIHVVLKIYHRIVCESKQEEKNIIYDEWLMDIPKMLYLIGVYGKSNRDIVQQIIGTLFQSIPQYREDFIDFLIIIEDIVLDQLYTNVSFQFKRTVTQLNANFSDPLKSFTTNLVKSVFTILDTYNSFIFLYEYFPEDLVFHFASNKGIQLNLLQFYSQFVQNIEGRWELLKQIKQPVSNSIEKARHKMIEYFLKTMNILYKALRTQNEKYFIKSLQTYLGICNLFLKSQRGESEKLKNLTYLVRIMIEYTGDRKLFFVTEKMKKIFSIEDQSVINQIFKLESKIQKKQLEQLNSFPSLDLKLQNIPTYKQWSFSFDDYQKFNEVVSDFEIPNFYDDEFAIGESKENTENLIIKNKKVKNVYGSEYDDEPEYEETQVKLDSLVIPVEQTLNDEGAQMTRERLSSRHYNNLTLKMSQESSKVYSRQRGQENLQIQQQTQNILDMLDQTSNSFRNEQLQNQTSSITTVTENSRLQEADLTITQIKNKSDDNDLTIRSQFEGQKLEETLKIEENKPEFGKKKEIGEYELQNKNYSNNEDFIDLDLSIRQKKPKKKYKKKQVQ